MTKSEKYVVIGLISLSAIPLFAGTLRVIEISSGAEVTIDNARFFESPLPVILHILSSMVYCVIGAFQFSNSIRQNYINWHRIAGRVLILSGLVSTLTGLWMTQFYPFVNYDGTALYIIRLIVSLGVVVSICLGLLFIIKRKFHNHSAWMMRGYALSLGAGTQVFTHLPWFIFPDIQGELARTICMSLGWIINLVVAEYIIMRRK